jgi:hypothetical protein
VLELDLYASAPVTPEGQLQATRVEQEATAMAREIDSFRRELGDLGIQLKDPRLGLVDFPATMDGRAVLLCWKLDEPEVRFWHEADAGFDGRKPLAPATAGS